MNNTNTNNNNIKHNNNESSTNNKPPPPNYNNSNNNNYRGRKVNSYNNGSYNNVTRGGGPTAYGNAGSPYNPYAVGYPAAPAYAYSYSAAYTVPAAGPPGGQWGMYNAAPVVTPGGAQAQSGTGAMGGAVGGSRGGTSSLAASSANARSFTPRKKNPLVIRDKQGNVVDFSKESKTSKADEEAAAAAKLKKEEEEAAAATKLKKEEEERKAKEEAEAKAATEEAARLSKEKEEAAAKAKVEEERKAAEAKAEEERKAAEAKAEEERKAAEAKVEEERKATEAKVEEERKATEAKAEEDRKATATPSLRPPGMSSLQKSRTEQTSTSLSPASQPLRPGGRIQTPSSSSGSKKRQIYTKEMLMSFKNLPICLIRPENLPDMTTTPKGDTGNRGNERRRQSNHGDSSWSRGARPMRRNNNNPNQNNMNNNYNNNTQQHDSWSRGQNVPNRQNKRGGRGHGRHHHHNNNNEFDGPVEPLVRSESRWKPVKDNSAVAVAEKKVKAILNKMTKEKFERLSDQMIQLPIASAPVLQAMINTVFEKAIDEPSFGDMYADLCALMSGNVNYDSFIHVIEGQEQGSQFYQWSADIGVDDAEVVGPFSSEKEAINHVFDADGESLSPIPRGDKQMKLVTLKIVDGIFIKVLQNGSDYYTVHFMVEDAQKGDISENTYMTRKECMAAAQKANSFKRSLLYKCEDEFRKSDIYSEWKEEKLEYENNKEGMTETERAEKEEEMDFRRIKIKKQMLGNIRFIGNLYKKKLLKETVMHECIMSLMKLQNKSQVKGMYDLAEIEKTDGMDEEDHEALCQLFNTIGKTIDTPSSKAVIDSYFGKVRRLSKDKTLNSRSRFMYQDLIELRANAWKSRRKEETSKTLQEIKKDFEREERAAARQSAAANSNYNNNNRRGGNRNSARYNNDNVQRKGSRAPIVDEDGFSSVSSKGRRNAPPPTQMSRSHSRSSQDSPMILQRKQNTRNPSQAQKKLKEISDEELFKRSIGLRNEYMSLKDMNEMILSVEELKGAKNWSVKLATKYLEDAIECKDAEREANADMLEILMTKNILQSSDFEAAMNDLFEFMDSFEVDAPRAYSNMALVIAPLLQTSRGLTFKTVVDVSLQFDGCNSVKLVTEIMKHIGDRSCISESEALKVLSREKWAELSK